MTRVKTIFLIFAVIGFSMTATGENPEPENPADKKTEQIDREQRLLREYIPPEAIVSMDQTLTFDKAIESLNELSKKFTDKVIVDPAGRDIPIGVDIVSKHWMDAFEIILNHNNLWYDEKKTHFQITTHHPEAPIVPETPFDPDRPTLRSREVNISAVFFEVNHDKVRESGISWDFFRRDVEFGDIGARFPGASGVVREDLSVDIEVSPIWSFANLTALIRLFESTGIGEVIASPEITVRSGERGRIQIGEDISIKQRDFAGNIIDVFISTGSIINVTPDVIVEDGIPFISLDISAERSSGIPGTISTVIAKAEAETKVLLLDGEETVIGGLFLTEERQLREGIPILKDLPWWFFGLRYVFGYNRFDTSKQEVIILLRASLVPTLEERVAMERERNPLLQRRLHYQQERERLQEK